MKRVIPFLCVMVLPVVAAAQDTEGYPEAYAARPLVLDAGMVQTGLDLGLGLIKGRMAKDITLGVGAQWGVVRNFELGLGIEAMNYSSGLAGAKFGGFDIAARYRFIDMLAAELHLFAPGDRTFVDSFSKQRVGLMLGIPFQWIAVRDMLKVHAALNFLVGFVADDYPTSGGDFPQMTLGLQYGLTYNPIRQLFLDLSFGTDFGLRPSAGSFGDRVAIPAALTLGGTLVRGTLDLYASFVLANLKPPVGNAFDNKAVGIGARMRF
ncbi:MAG TPA: hypothetical protein PLQ97_12400 [Myxococcota bacterium]|nr:hypothetical protein [Myxococcota bacterium]HQK51991.1 hypothetical protein [Myxococcota bacterium]